MNFLSKTALTTACAMSFSIVAAPAAALTADQKRRVSFAMAATFTWGAVGTFSTLMSRYVQTTPGQDVWGQSVGVVCGAAAAGLGNEWSPDKSVLTGQALAFASLKSASVIGPTVLCNWATIGLMKWHTKAFVDKANNGTGRWNMPERMKTTEASVSTVQADYYRARDLYKQLQAANRAYALRCSKIPDLQVALKCVELRRNVEDINAKYSSNYSKTKYSLRYMASQLDKEANNLGLDIRNP